MRVVFLGCTKFSQELLDHILANDVEVAAVYTIPEEFGISYSAEKVRNFNFADLRSYAEAHGISCRIVDSSGSGRKLLDYYDQIKQEDPDVILVAGWYYMVPKKIREIPKYGTWGIHASLLPDYAGGAPLVWAIIEGCEETGVSLFRLGDGVDDGDIIGQARFKIEETDTISEVYDKATTASKTILLEALRDPEGITFTPQDPSRIRVYPQRSPSDGEIDLSKPARELYNFVRAQSSPYPGSFIRTIDGKKLVIERARIED